MLRLVASDKIRRLIREDDWEDLGTPTQELIGTAIDAGRYDEAKALAGYFIPEGKALHDLFCDWIWDLFTKISERDGEEAVYGLCRATQETWMMRRTWKGLSAMSVEQRVYLNAEVMRSHRCGPAQDGTIDIFEEDDRYSIRMDPCGSGGRLYQGEMVPRGCFRYGAAPFVEVQEPSSVTFQRAPFPTYCIHCAATNRDQLDGKPWPFLVDGEAMHAPGAPCRQYLYKKTAPRKAPARLLAQVGLSTALPLRKEYVP